MAAKTNEKILGISMIVFGSFWPFVLGLDVIGELSIDTIPVYLMTTAMPLFSVIAGYHLLRHLATESLNELLSSKEDSLSDVLSRLRLLRKKEASLAAKVDKLETEYQKLVPLASYLERRTSTVLDSLSIEYKTQVKFSDCRHKLPLPFDFGFVYGGTQYLIECDGKQHFEPVEKWGGEEAFEQVKLRDAIKTKYCTDNDIVLIRIPYTMKNSSDLIESEILKSLNGAG